MKKFFAVALMLAGVFSFGQERDSSKTWENDERTVIKKISPLTKKGTMFFTYGWNRAAFSKSDIHFRKRI